VQPYAGLPAISLQHEGGRFVPAGWWYRENEYLRELERGLDFREDLYSPDIVEFAMEEGRAVFLTATIGERLADPKELLEKEGERRAFPNRLTRALDQFRVRRADGKPTLLAGYPWFTDWSRDTLISLPAYLRASFPATEVRDILAFLLGERDQGILPNRFSDVGSAPEYNTVDATLWFFVAADVYIAKTSDKEFLESVLYPAALDILEWHHRGTHFGIAVDPTDRLLRAGEPGMQLTWMDARVGNEVITPRIGKPVEINALWYNALCVVVKWADALGISEAARALAEEAQEVLAAFQTKFWNAERECLFDVVTDAGPDASLRPNQLFALALPYRLLEPERAQKVMQVIEKELLTPAGIRTLERSDPRYRARFVGNMAARDSAYHQGTVWPWLMGPFVSAYLYAFGRSDESVNYCQRAIESVLAEMAEYGLGSIGEVADADPPHRPGGCPAQLWSVAQLVLALDQVERD
jgi:predicted glycogen debranching enzyme